MAGQRVSSGRIEVRTGEASGTIMKTASVINNPEGQTISLPTDVRVKGDEVFVKRIGESIVLIPVHADPWRPLVESLDLFSEDFMENRQQPPSQSRGAMFE